MTCAEQIGPLLGGRIAEWRGIDPECRIDDLRETFPIDDDWGGVGYLGEEEWDAEYVGITAEESGEESGNDVRLWHDEEGRLLLVEIIDPRRFPTVDALLDTLGHPDTRLDATVGLRRGRQNEWVYPERGLTLYVTSDTEHVERVLGFVPTSVEEYTLNLRPNLEGRRLQIR